MLIPSGGKFIYENYEHFKHVYWLTSSDTLELLNDTVLVHNSTRLMLDFFDTEFDVCDTLVNKIRNSSLSRRNYSMLEDSCSKYIGRYNTEFKIVGFDDELEKKVCHESFVKMASQRFDSLYTGIKNIYASKIDRATWISAQSKVDRDFITSFLKDYKANIPDNEVFVRLLIINPLEMIEEIDKLEFPNEIFWQVKDFKGIKGTQEAIQVLEKVSLKGKSRRKLVKLLNKNVS